MLRAPDVRRVERLLGVDDHVVALVPATPHDALPDTVRAVVSGAIGLRRRSAATGACRDDTTDAYAVPAPPVDLGTRRQVLVALTSPSDRLVVIGVDRLGRPVEVVWWSAAADVGHVAVAPARLLGVATEELVVAVPGGQWRFVLARPHRRSGRELAARLGAGVRYSEG